MRQRRGSIAREQARHDDARALHTRSLAIWEALGEDQGVASPQKNYLGFVAWLCGDFAGVEPGAWRRWPRFAQPAIQTGTVSRSPTTRRWWVWAREATRPGR